MSIVNLVEDDTGPVIPLYVTNSVTGEAVDLTTMVSARLLYRSVAAPLVNVATVTLTVLGAPTLGVLSLTPTATMTAAVGNFEGEIEITMPGSVVVTGFVPVQFYVRAQFP